MITRKIRIFKLWASKASALQVRPQRVMCKIQRVGCGRRVPGAEGPRCHRAGPRARCLAQGVRGAARDGEAAGRRPGAPGRAAPARRLGAGAEGSEEEEEVPPRPSKQARSGEEAETKHPTAAPQRGSARPGSPRPPLPAPGAARPAERVGGPGRRREEAGGRGPRGPARGLGARLRAAPPGRPGRADAAPAPAALTWA